MNILRKQRRFSLMLISLIMIALLQPLYAQPYEIMSIGELRGLSVDQVPTAYTGSNQAFQRIVVASYSDLGQTEKDPALRMALLGVMKGSGNKIFSPSKTLNAIEGLIVINRIMGNEATVAASIAAAIAGQSPANALAKLYDAHYNQTLGLGITTVSEGQGYFKPITKELFYTWIARAGAFTPETTTPLLDAATDDASISPEHRGLIEALLKEKVITLKKGAISPKSSISRKEAVMILDSIAPRFYTAMGLTESYGVVIGTKRISGSQYGQVTTADSAVLRLEDGTLVQIGVQNGLKDGTDTEVATLRNSQVSGLSSLVIGDEVRLLMSDATTVQIAEVLPTGSVLSRLKATLEASEGIVKFVGNIEQIVPETMSTVDTVKSGYRLRVRSVDGIINDILIMSDSKTGIKSDVIVTKAGVITYGNQYTIGNTLAYYVKDESEVIYASLDQAGIDELSGTLQKIETDDQGKTTLTIYDYDNKLHSYTLSPHVAISINFRPALAVDLKVGSEVRLLAVDHVIMRLTTESYIREPGYIPPGGKILFGQVQYIRGNDIYLLGESLPYTVDSQTIFTKNGLGATLYTLKEGDRIKFYLSQISNNSLYKVEIEGPEQLLAGVYKANVMNLKISTNTLALGDPYILKNQEWMKSNDQTMELVMAKDVAIYRGGKLITKSTLGSMKGQGIYLVTRSAYGTQEIAQIVVKGVNERVYSDTVGLYDPVISKLELTNKVNISLLNGTIYIKEGRLVTESAIIEEDGIFVVGSSTLGITESAIVEMIPGQSTPMDSLYAGAIEVVNSYSLSFLEVYQNADFEWSSMGDDKFFISDDTSISDVTVLTPVPLTRYKLFHGSYSRDDNKGTDNIGLTYERYYTFFVVSPGTKDIVGMVIRKKELLTGRPIDDAISSESLIDNHMKDALAGLLYTRGTVEDFDVKWNRVKLRDAYDYVSFSEEWSPNRTSEYVELTGTLIIKGDQVIEFEDLKAGDRVMIIRDDEDAIVLRVIE